MFHWLAIEGPYPTYEVLPILLHCLEDSCPVDRGFNFGARTDDAGILQEAFDVGSVILATFWGSNP
jgi:hypothetical protein